MRVLAHGCGEGGGGGVPTKIFYLCYLGTHAKIQNSTSLSRSYMRFSGQNRVIWGVGEVPQSYHLCYLEAHAKKWTPMMSLSWIYLEIGPFLVQLGLMRGGGQNLFFIGILTTLFRLTAFFLVEKQRPQSEERKEKEKIMPWTIASTFMPAATGSTRTPLGQPAITWSCPPK